MSSAAPATDARAGPVCFRRRRLRWARISAEVSSAEGSPAGAMSPGGTYAGVASAGTNSSGTASPGITSARIAVVLSWCLSCLSLCSKRCFNSASGSSDINNLTISSCRNIPQNPSLQRTNRLPSERSQRFISGCGAVGPPICANSLFWSGCSAISSSEMIPRKACSWATE